MTAAGFDPFQDRLGRDIRNDLSRTLPVVFARRSLDPASKVATRYLEADIDRWYRDYIDDRLARYAKALATAGAERDPIRLALILWNLGLFFEVHEILEDAWRQAASGPHKKVLQALIRAAGTYIKLEHGYTQAAAKMAGRALPVLEEHRTIIAGYFEPEPLLRSLRNLALPPPKLLA